VEKEEMKKQLEKKKIFISKFTGDEPIFGIASHRGVDPGVKEGIRPVRRLHERNDEADEPLTTSGVAETAD
jgi:hypothetical protein